MKGPGERPHEYLFITADNVRARIGEFVYYTARDGQAERRIIGNVTERRLVRNLPDTFLSDPETPPSVVSSLIGLEGEGCELYEITVETIGYFHPCLATSSTRASRRGPATRSSSPLPRRSPNA